jgi:hypothetical protein
MLPDVVTCYKDITKHCHHGSLLYLMMMRHPPTVAPHGRDEQINLSQHNIQAAIRWSQLWPCSLTN